MSPFECPTTCKVLPPCHCRLLVVALSAHSVQPAFSGPHEASSYRYSYHFPLPGNSQNHTPSSLPPFLVTIPVSPAGGNVPPRPLCSGEHPLLTLSKWALLSPQMSDVCYALREASGDMMNSLQASVGTRVPPGPVTSQGRARCPLGELYRK